MKNIQCIQCYIKSNKLAILSINAALHEDSCIDDGAELLALEQLLSTAAELEQEYTNANKFAAPTIENAVPCLREDSTFAETFSYVVDLPAAKLRQASKVTKSEELDSSDDEEIRNFLERKYNEYGNDINKKLKQQKEAAHELKVAYEVDTILKTTDAAEAISTNKTSNLHIKNPHNHIKRISLVNSNNFKQPVASSSTTITTTTPEATTKPATNVASAIYTDPIFGLRIINPLVSSSLLTERMSGRNAVTFANIAFHIERGDLSRDWVIAGVIVSKQPVRSTKNGDPYSMWRLSDLRGEIRMVTLFLFKDAHKNLWKTAEGMCLAVLNPTIFEKRSSSTDVACLCIDNSQKVMILGQSKDLGMCSARKKNGEKCAAIVNLTDCDYCVYHVKQEYGKMSRRSELQSATSGRGLNELRNKVLGKSEVFYGGQSFSAVPARKSNKLMSKDKERLVMLSEYAVSPFARNVNHTSQPRALTSESVPYAKRSGSVSRVAGNVEASRKQRLKDLKRIELLKAEEEKQQAIKQTAISTVQMNTPEKYKNCKFSFTGTPKLSNENFCIEVNVNTRQAQAAKLKAIQILKQRPIEKANPNSTRGTTEGKRRVMDEWHEEFKANSAKRQKIEEEEREKARKSRIERIIAATSVHKNLIDLRENEQQTKYFDNLEKKEAMEEKMLSTYKVACKAVICQLCKYTSFSASERCKTEKHPLKVVDASKRFFQCKDCGNRTTTVFKLPKLSCSNCKGSNWLRAAMIKERKAACTEILSIRGDEEMFLGNLSGGANLNLLVPDD